MNFWFLVWVFIAFFIMGIFFWSILVLMRQKNAWKTFANRHSLDYRPVAAMSSAAVSGIYKSLPFSLSSEAQFDEERQGKNFRTIIQIDLGEGMPAEGIIGSPSMRDFVSSLPLPEEFIIKDEKWNDEICIRTNDAKKLDDYFTPQRVAALNALMSIKGVNVLYIFSEKEALLRFESPDPFDNIEKLERFATKAVDAAKIIACTNTRKE